MIANIGLYTADIIILSDQSYISIGNKPKRLQVLHNVHVRIAIHLNETDLKLRVIMLILYTIRKPSLTMPVIVCCTRMEGMLIVDSPIQLS